MTDILNDENTTTITLQPSKEKTEKMVADKPYADDIRDLIVEMGAGNPGAVVALMDIGSILDPNGFKCLLISMRVKKLQGSQLYSFVKQHGGAANAIAEFEKAGWV